MTEGDNPDLQALGRFVREHRQRLQLTQTQLAERLGWVQERISMVENARYGMPSLPALVRLSKALETSLASTIEAAGYDGVTPMQGGSGEQPSNMALQYTLQRLLTIEATDVREALNEASDMLVQAMGADKIDAFLYDPTSESLLALGTSNTPMGRKQHQVGLDRMPLANRGRVIEVFENGEVFYTGQADLDPGIHVGVKETLGVRSLLAVPMHVDSKVHGVLVAESSHPDRFSQEEQQFFVAATRWVGMVAKRAELTEAMTRTAAEEARRMAAEELVTLLAHDLGNALTPIKGRLQMMQRRFDREGRGREIEDTREVSRSVDRVDRMVSELLDVARLDQGLLSLALQPIDLVEITENVVSDLRGIHPHIDVRPPEELVVQADPGRITQVLNNLIQNAIQHSPGETPIVVFIGTKNREDGEWALIEVHDEGPGIPQEMMSNLFTRFSSGPGSTGMGLGLFLARSIAESHGGTVTVESSSGTGTTFCLYLPMAVKR